MSWIRGFSSEGDIAPATRIVEHAPDQMRQEVVDLVFGIAEHSAGALDPQNLYRISSQNLGLSASGNPYSGPRYAAGRDIKGVPDNRVFDLIVRLCREFEAAGLNSDYKVGVNRILAAHGIAWDLGDDCNLHRVLPAAVQGSIRALFTELADQRYSAALPLFVAAMQAYDDRPRRDRDACANVFDAMESVAKIKYSMPNSTFGNVKDHVSKLGLMRPEIVDILTSLNQLRNQHFGHGMTAAFGLSVAEVDFVFLECIAVMLLLLH
jgi:hypothetical protein